MLCSSPNPTRGSLARHGAPTILVATLDLKEIVDWTSFGKLGSVGPCNNPYYLEDPQNRRHLKKEPSIFAEKGTRFSYGSNQGKSKKMHLQLQLQAQLSQ